MTVRQRSWLLPPAALVLVAGVFAGRITDCIIFPACALPLALLSVLLLKKRLRFIACLLVCFSLGAFAGCFAFHPVLPEEGEYSVSGVISDEITTGSFGQYRVFLSDVTLDGRSLSGGAYWTFYDDTDNSDLVPGKTVSFHASLYHPRGAENPDGYNFRESLLQRGIKVGIYGKDELSVAETTRFSFHGTLAALRHKLSLRLRKTLGDETGVYASALLFGYRSLIPSEDRQAFARLGIAHILSVSGFHVGILIGALAALFRLLHLRQSIRICLYTIVLFFYTALCGMSQPVIRASLLLLLNVEGRILNRPRSGIHLLSGVLFIMTLFSPVQVTSASFQLTFCAMFGLIWFEPVRHRFRFPCHTFFRKLLDSILLTFGVQLGLLFPELLFFHRFPLLVFLINLPATLVFSFLISLFWLVFVLLPFPALTAFLSGPLSSLTTLCFKVIRCLSSAHDLTLWIHNPNVITAAGVILLFLAFCAFVRFRPVKRALLFCIGTVLLVVSLLPFPHHTTEYIQFSVGNADAAILHDLDKVYVIDAGENDGTVSSYLRAHRLTPDAVILTHLHADHAGGLQSMIDDGIPVRLLCLPEGADTQDINPDFRNMISSLRSSGTEIRILSRGDVIPLPSGTFTVLWPEKGKIRPGQDANNYSLVARLTLKGTTLLHTGDVTGSYEHYSALPADLLKVSHHGSSSSTSESFLSAVSPDVILLSCRHVSRLQSFRERAGTIPVYSTSECGAVTVQFDENGYSVSTFLSH